MLLVIIEVKIFVCIFISPVVEGTPSPPAFGGVMTFAGVAKNWVLNFL